MVATIRSILAAFVLLSATSAVADVTELNTQELQKLQSEGVTIIDVRRADEWAQTGMLEGSHGITFFDEKGRYDVDAWLAEVSSLTVPEQPVVLICAHGVRSSKIARLLDKHLGFTAVHNVTDGIYAWLDDKQPVVPWTASPAAE